MSNASTKVVNLLLPGGVQLFHERLELDSYDHARESLPGSTREARILTLCSQNGPANSVLMSDRDTVGLSIPEYRLPVRFEILMHSEKLDDVIQLYDADDLNAAFILQFVDR